MNQCIAQLKKDDLLQPSKGNVPNDNGLRLLHEFWPEEFELPERFRYEQDDIRFEMFNVCSKFAEKPKNERNTICKICSILNTGLNVMFKFTPLRG